MATNEFTLEKLDELIDQSKGYDELKRDFRVDVGHVSFKGHDTGMSLVIPDQNETDLRRNRGIWHDYEPIDGMAGFKRPPISFLDTPAQFDIRDDVYPQMFQKLSTIHWDKASRTGSIPLDFMKQFSHWERADILNMIKAKAPMGQSWMVRTFGHESRAILDGDYPRTWNTEVLQATRELVANADLGDDPIFPRPRITEDNTYIRIYWDDTGTDEGGGLKVGVVIANGETGGSATKILPMIYRGECSNGLIFESTDTSRVGITISHHRSRSPRVMMAQFVEQFPEVMRISASAITRMLDSQEVRLPDFNNVLEGLRIEHNWSRNVTNDVIAGTEKQDSVFGLVNGITYAAHTSTENADTEYSMEKLGGKYLFANMKTFERLARQGRKGEKIRA